MKTGNSNDDTAFEYSGFSGIDYYDHLDKETKNKNVKFSLSKYEFSLYKEGDAFPSELIRIKRFVTKDEECWKFFINSNPEMINSNPIFILNSKDFNKKQIDFLRSVDGFQFLVEEFKYKRLDKLVEKIKKL